MFEVANDNQKSGLEKAILETIAFFDLFDFPPTVPEIAANLGNKFSLIEVSAALDNLSKIQSARGQFFLPGRAEIINIRQARYNYYRRKLKIARHFARLFSICPAVKAICLANVIGPHNLRDESDIDFFIIAAPGKIWQARLYCAGLAALLNKRPKKDNKRDKICLSFYLSASHLNVSHLKLQPFDPYFDYWLRNLVLLYNKDRAYDDFLTANGLPASHSGEKILAPNNQDKKERGLIEKLARFFQLAIMNPALKEAAQQAKGVVISDQILKLYLKDNRQEYLKKYGDKLQQVFAQNY